MIGSTHSIRGCLPRVLGDADMQEHFKTTTPCFHVSQKNAAHLMYVLRGEIYGPFFKALTVNSAARLLQTVLWRPFFSGWGFHGSWQHSFTGEVETLQKYGSSIKQPTLTECLRGASALLAKNDPERAKQGPWCPPHTVGTDSLGSMWCMPPGSNEGAAGIFQGEMDTNMQSCLRTRSAPLLHTSVLLHSVGDTAPDACFCPSHQPSDLNHDPCFMDGTPKG